MRRWLKCYIRANKTGVGVLTFYGRRHSDAAGEFLGLGESNDYAACTVVRLITPKRFKLVASLCPTHVTDSSNFTHVL